MERTMGTVQYRIEPNLLTKPTSYKLRFLPQQTAGYDELAAAIAKDNGVTNEQAKAFLLSMVNNVRQMLGNGIQVTLEEAFTFCLSFPGFPGAADQRNGADQHLGHASLYPSRAAIYHAGTGRHRGKSPDYPLRRRHELGVEQCP
jgi:hypothetical protein